MDTNQKNCAVIFKKYWAIVLSFILLITTITFAFQISSYKTKISELEEQLLNTQIELNNIKNSSSLEIAPIREAFVEEKWEEVILLAKEFQIEHENSKENEEAQKMANKAQKKIDEEFAKKEAENDTNDSSSNSGSYSGGGKFYKNDNFYSDED